MADPTDWAEVPADHPIAQAAAAPIQPKAGDPADWTAVQTPHTDVAESTRPDGTHIDQDGLVHGIREHMAAGHPAEDIKNYIIQNGYIVPPATDRYLRETYKPGDVSTYHGFGVDHSNEKQDPNAEQPGITVTGKPEQISAGEAAWRGVRHNALGHWDDELAAASGAVGNKIGSALGLNKSNASYDEIYQHLLDQERQTTDQAYAQHPGAYGAGAGAGMMIMPTKGLGLARDASAAAKVGDAAFRGMQAGAEVGSGDAQGGLGDRVEGAVKGGITGAIAAPIVGKVVGTAVKGVGGLARRAGMLPGSSAETSGLAALDSAAPQDTEALAGRAQDMRAAGVNPRLVDVLDSRGRRVVRNSATHLDAANEATNAADASYSDLQGNVASKAGIIGPKGASADAPGVVYRGGHPITDGSPGFYTPDKQAAESYVGLRGPGGEVTAHKVDIKNPAPEDVVMAEAARSGHDPEDLRYQTPASAFDKDLHGDHAVDTLTSNLKAKGYDGAILKDITPPGGYQKEIDAHIPFDAKQVSPAPLGSAGAKTARQLVQATADEQSALGPSFRAVADKPVPLTPESEQALGTPEGINALKRVSRMLPPDQRDQVSALITHLKTPPIADPVESGMIQLKNGGKQDISGFPTPVRQKIVDQMRDQGQLLEAQPAPPLTVDVADKFARAMNSPLSRQGGLANMALQLGKTVRGAARDAVPEYDQALTQYEGVSRVGEAAAGTGKYEGTGFLNSPPDAHGPAVAGANPVGPEVTHLATGEQAQIPSEADALRLRAQQDVVDKAQAGNRSALGVADQLATGGHQQVRNEQLLGADDAATLRAGMAGEAAKVRNTMAVDPRLGSQTHTLGEDDQAIGDLAHALTSASHGNFAGAAMRTVSNWMKRAGVRGIDANRMVRDAMSEDPDRLDASIRFLQARGVPPSTGGKIMLAIKNAMPAKLTGAVGTGAGAANGTEDPIQAPNSVRMVNVMQRGTGDK